MTVSAALILIAILLDIYLEERKRGHTDNGPDSRGRDRRRARLSRGAGGPFGRQP